MTDHAIKGKTVIIAQGAKAIAIHYNSQATKPDADATVAAVKAAVGRPDIAINTVGKVLKKPITSTTTASS